MANQSMTTNSMYVGPSIPQWGLKQNTIYRGDTPPAKLLEMMIAKPAMRSLFVSTKNLAKAKKQLNKKGTLEYTASQELLAIARTLPR